MAFTEAKPLNIGAVGNATTLVTQYDLPIADEVLIKHSYNERTYFIDDMFKMYGMRAKGTSKKIIAHAERGRMDENVMFDQIVTPAGGPNNPMTVRLSPTYMLPAVATVGGVAIGGSPLRQWDIILGPDAEPIRVQQKISTGAQHQFVLMPVKAGTDLDAIITPGSLATREYPNAGNIYPEGSNVLGGKVTRITKYTNDHQIIKEAIKFTGSEETYELYHKNTEGENPTVRFVYLEPMKNHLFKRDRSYALLTGERITNPQMALYNNPELGEDTAVRATQGMLPFIEQYAHADTGVNFTTYGIDDFTRVAFRLEQAGVHSTEYLTIANTETISRISRNLLQQFDSTVDTYVSRIYDDIKGMGDKYNYGSAEGFAALINFKAITVDTFKFVFRSLHEFNDLKGLYAIDKYKNYAMFLPLGRVKDAEDPTRTNTLCGMSYRVAPNDSYSREVIMGSWAGFGTANAMNVPISSGWDIGQSAVMCDIGFHGCCGSNYLYQTT